MLRRKSSDIEATAGAQHQPGPTLLPGPVAHAVSLATRSTSLAIRVGSLVGCCGLDAARFTTVSSLQLARGMVEVVLNRAARDTITKADSEVAVADAETILEKSLESLHYAVTQIVFWTSAGFRLSGTSISTASDASQLLLGSLDQVFGSTDSSRAVASIITLVRREFNNPSTGAAGEKVGVTDLVLALGALAYLQRACRRSAVEEARRQSYEEVIWDVVVLSDGERIDVKESSDTPSPAGGSPYYEEGGLGIRYGSDDDEAVMDRLKSYISSNLTPGSTVSISNSVNSVQTITVDVQGPQLLSLPTPPGAEIIETRGPSMSPGSRRSWASMENTDKSYKVVYRIERDKLRSATFRGEEEDAGPVVEITDETESTQAPPPPPPRSPVKDSDARAHPSVGDKRRRLSQVGRSTPEPAANQKKPRLPPSEPKTTTEGKRSLSKKKGETALAAARGSDKKNGLKQALKEGGQSLSNMWKDSSEGEAKASAKQRPQWKGAGSTSASSASTSTSKLKPSMARNQVQPQRTPRLDEPFNRPSSRASFVSIHERRRDSIVSLTDSYSRGGGMRPSSPTVYRTDFATQETLRPGDLSVPPSPPRKGHHRRSTSYAPSMYSLATNDSQQSLLLSSYYQKSAYNASDALNTLRNEGFVDGTFPAGHLLPNITRYMRYSSACYGSHFLRLLGMSKELPTLQVGDRTHRDVRHFVHHTETQASNILLASFVDPQGGTDGSGSTGTGVPLVHYVSLDHEAKAVVLACRGTLGFEDVLADLTCDYDSLVWRNRAYRVHKGIHASARRLLYGDDGRVLVTLKEALIEFPDYGLVLCGHSLGGGVTSLLGIMLSEPNPDGPGFVISAEPHAKLLTQGANTKFTDVRLPQGRRIHVYAYGSPGVMSSSLRKITRGLITTVVHGNDIVPHLSLGLLHDFQGLALGFKNDENQTKAEIRRRMWLAIQTNLADKWYQTTPAAPKEGDEEWVLPMLQALRDTMKGKKLVPPGEVFVVETQRVLRRDAFVFLEEGTIGRPARRVVLKYIRDVEGRFGEIKFGSGLLTDHSPAKYEDALNKLRLGVVE